MSHHEETIAALKEASQAHDQALFLLEGLNGVHRILCQSSGEVEEILEEARTLVHTVIEEGHLRFGPVSE